MRPPLGAVPIVVIGLGLGAVGLSADVPVVPNRIPGGLASGDGAVGFIASPRGGFAAVDLKTGKDLWECVEGDFPISLDGDLLAVWRGPRDAKTPPRIVVVDAKQKGKLVRESEPLFFPTWVVVGRDPFGPDLGTGHGLLSMEASVEGRTLRLAWHALARSQAGNVRAQGRGVKEAAGTIRVDLDTGAVRAEEAAPPATADGAVPASHPYHMAGAWRVDPFRVSGHGLTSVLALSSEGEKSGLVLKRREAKSGREIEPVVLSRGPHATREVSQVSPDGQHLFLHREYAAGEKAPERVPWRVFSVPNGVEVATLTFEPGAADVAVVGSTVFYRLPAASGRPGRLKAVDLKTGAELWSRPLPDSRPPAAPSPARRP